MGKLQSHNSSLFILTSLNQTLLLFDSQIDRVQDYYDSTDEWSYQDELYKFVDGGYDDDMFIDAVSNIAARGCHKPSGLSCSRVGSVETNRFLYGLERRMHLKNIIRVSFCV